MMEMMVGFDTNIPVDAEWDAGITTYIQTTGRFAGFAAISQFGTPATLQKTLPNQKTRIVGFAINFNSFNDYAILTFKDGFTEQISLNISSLGELIVKSGVNVLSSTGPNIVRVGAWYYFEFSVTIGNSDGAFELRIGEQPILMQSGIDTQQTANAHTNIFSFAIIRTSSAGSYALDDFYCLNTSGPKNNAFLGERKILTTTPVSDDSITFARNTGSTNFSAVASYDSAFTFSHNVGDEDRFGMGPLVGFTGNQIAAMKSCIIARKDDVGLRKIANVVKSGATETVFSDAVLLSTDEAYSVIVEVDPDTSLDWTTTGINNAKSGYKLTA